MSATEQTDRIKCLLVDDLQENLLALSALLKRNDVELLQARSGPEALELLLAHDVALAILDVQMPDMDGFELAEIMRSTERTRNVPIIFVTAGGRDPHRVFKGYDSGAVDFLFKPIEPHILRSKADVFFQLYRQKQQLAQSLKERTETLRVNEMFTAVLGHDLRGPLSAMMMAAEILSRRDDATVHEVGARMLRSGRWMGRMIEDMLDLARTRVGTGMPVKRTRSDLGALADRIAQERQCTAPERALNIKRLGDLVGEWDEDRMAQVVSNLIGNALRHGDSQQPVDIELDGLAAGEVVMAVGNGGVIAPDVLPHIFDPFRSGRTQSRRAEGLGLGLYIVQQIVWAHGGTLEVRSDPVQRRTVFTLKLPRGSGSMAAPPHPAGS
jgi:signal transduction histidine kinase